MDLIQEFIDVYLDEHGRTKETWDAIIRDFREVIADYGISINVEIEAYEYDK